MDPAKAGTFDPAGIDELHGVLGWQTMRLRMRTFAWGPKPRWFGLMVAICGLSAALPVPTADPALGRVLEIDSQPVDVAEVETVDDTERVATALSRCGAALSKAESRSIAETIVDESEKHGYDPLFVQAIVEVESTCRPTARSPAGAVGLIQLIPSTARDVARRYGIRWQGTEGLMRPEISVELGLRYLAELEDQFADPYLAMAAYNLGPGRVAGMHPTRARGSQYVRKVLGRYEGLLRAHPTAAS